MPITLHHPDARAFDEVQQLGIAIGFNDRGGQHIGFLYKEDGKAARLCHLAHHFDMRDSEPSKRYRWIQTTIGKENRAVLVEIIRNIIDRKTRIPYGIRYEKDYLTPNGEYIKRGLGNGLTCATFILAVCRASAIELLRCEEWPAGREGDLEFQADQIAALRQCKKYQFHADNVSQHLGDSRY